MAKQTINIGASPNDGTGTPLRTAFDYTNLNFTELYTALGGGVGLPGATTQVIFNDGGTNLAGDAGLVFDKTTDKLTIAGNVQAASATITGAATVGTTLGVTGNLTVACNGPHRFGTSNYSQFDQCSLQFVGSRATPGALSIYGNGSRLIFQCDTVGYLFQNATNTLTLLSITNDATQLTLNSTGLGVGISSPAYKLDVNGTANCNFLRVTNASGTALSLINTTSALTYTLYSANTASNGFNGFGIFNGTDYDLKIVSGNVGVGVTPSTPWATNRRVLQIGGTNSGTIALTGTSGSGELFFNSFFNTTSQNICVVTGGTGKYDFNVSTVGCHSWSIGTGTAGNAFTFTQAMTLDSSGNLLVGTTNTSATAGPGFKAQYSSTVPQFAIVTNEAGSSTALSLYNVNAAAYRFYVNNAGTVFATNVVISAISDARYKENVQDIDVGLAAILSLKPRKFDWKAGKGKDIKGDRGFIAQEFETVFPNLVDEWKDPAPEGEAPYKSVRQDLIPVLVKAIQELTARVQTLEAR